MKDKLTPVGHHLLNAYIAWFAENNIDKVHVLVDVSKNPSPFVRELGKHLGRTVMNIGSLAVRSLIIDNKGISFKARFSGIEHHVFLELGDIIGIEIPIGDQPMLIDLLDFQRIFKELKGTSDHIEQPMVNQIKPKLCIVK
jgi:stringent starvation protein B